MKCKDLTKEQMSTTNGCGSSDWRVSFLRIPDFASKWLGLYCPCCCHDWKYQIGSDKEVADLELRAGARHSALTGKKWLKMIKWKIGDGMYFALNTKISKACYEKNQR